MANGRRKDLYLGRWNSPASRAGYARVTTLVAASGGFYPSAADDVTVNEALVRRW